MMEIIEDIGRTLPDIIQKPLRYVYGMIPPSIRYNRIFWQTYKFLQESQWWGAQELEDYSVNQLKKLINHAYDNVPYYRKVFDERGLKPNNIQDFKDLQKLPFITKETIQEQFNDLVPRNYPKFKLQYVTTGGSTGIPLGLLYERNVSQPREWAFMLTQWRRVGFKVGDKCAVLRGDVVRSSRNGSYWDYDPISRNLILSSYHMTDENLPKYVAKIKEFKPDFIQAYPSTITVLAKFMNEHNKGGFPGLKALLCGSESLYSWQRELLEEVFQCRVYSWYGHTEMAVLAGECEVSSSYHIFPEYGFVELINKGGSPVTSENELGEIVATGINTFAFPLIRYRTMDLATWEKNKCKCGRNYPLLKGVEGRFQDLVVTKDNGLVTLTALIFAQHFDAFSKVKEMQLVQEKHGEIIVKIVRTPQYIVTDEEEILYKMKNAVGGRLEIQFDYVEHIPRTNSGKYRFLIQGLPVNFNNVGD